MPFFGGSSGSGFPAQATQSADDGTVSIVSTATNDSNTSVYSLEARAIDQDDVGSLFSFEQINADYLTQSTVRVESRANDSTNTDIVLELTSFDDNGGSNLEMLLSPVNASFEFNSNGETNVNFGAELTGSYYFTGNNSAQAFIVFSGDYMSTGLGSLAVFGFSVDGVEAPSLGSNAPVAGLEITKWIQTNVDGVDGFIPFFSVP